MNFPFAKWMSALEVLSAADRALIIGAVCDYIYLGYDCPELPPALMASFNLIREEVDAICLKRKAALRKRLERQCEAQVMPAPPAAVPEVPEEAVVIDEVEEGAVAVEPPGRAPATRQAAGKPRIRKKMVRARQSARPYSPRS
nr:hypothetical protein [Bacteroides sp.]